MTRDVIAQFSCSLYTAKDAELNRIPEGKHEGDFKDYHAVVGSTFNEEYSETLDSAVLVLSQISKEDRLSYIKPYDYVRVVDLSTYDEDTGTYTFDKLYLVDNFNEKENNIFDHIFGYTINLMSETKWLEKIQCPNRTITHKVNEDGTISKKTIYQLIKENMELYVPKIKYTNDGITWSYQPLISFPNQYEQDGVTETDFYKKFNVPCYDTGSSAYTLRQLLTLLMQQIGCIPTVNNRVLGYLDFKAEGQPFGGEEEDYTLDNTVNYINRSLSSDSFANTLINMSDNVLDSENEVICETLGFRDKSNVLLKQTQNLYLETNFPIYKINKCILHAPGKYSGYISSSYNCFIIGNSPGYYPVFYYRENTISANTATVTVSCSFVTSNSHIVKIQDNKIYFLKRNVSTGVYSVAGSATFNDFELNSDNTIQTNMDYGNGDVVVSAWNRTFTFSGLENDIVGFFFSGTVSNSYGSRNFSFIKFDDSDSNVKYGYIKGTDSDLTNVPLYNAAVAGYPLTLAGTRTWDITKLVVEDSVRQLLERDFTKMDQELTSSNLTNGNVDKVALLSKYVYGTVGYSIGSKQISGFSEVFNVGSSSLLGWLVKDYTYIENIINILSYDFSYQKDLLLEQFEFLQYIPIEFGYSNGTVEFPAIMSYGSLINYSFKYYSPISGNFSGIPFFTTCFVDLYYQPLNSFNLAYTKSEEDIDISIAQYDGNASGLVDFDRLSIHEQEQVDRIGNEVLTINQRTTDYADIQDFSKGPLIFKDDTDRDGEIDDEDKGIEYVIFKRSFTINNNHFNASYTGSKGAVLKNYFTSIRTKYRAYQYVSYGQSTIRKERDTFFVRVASDWYRGDDRIWLGNYQSLAPARNVYNMDFFIYDLTNKYTKPVSYECEYDQALVSNGLSEATQEMETIKNSVSLIATSNMLGIIYECPDNVGAGPYIENLSTNSNLGGVPQYWQIWDDSYSEKHVVSYVNNIDFYSLSKTSSGDSTVIASNVRKWGKTPIVDSAFFDIATSLNVVFSVCDNNMVTYSNYKDAARTFYKDVAEYINHSVQFIYYSPYNEVLFGEDFISGTPLLGRFKNPFNAIYKSNKFDLDTERHELDGSYHEIADGTRAGNVVLNETNTVINEIIIYEGLIPVPTKYRFTFTYIVDDILADSSYFKLLFDQMTVVGINPDEVVSYQYFRETKRIKIVAEIDYSNPITTFEITIPYIYIEDGFYSGTITKVLGLGISIDRLTITWGSNDVKYIKLCNKDENGEVVDIATFKRPKDNPATTTYFFTINDTKTDYVLSEKNGILYKRAIVNKSDSSTILTSSGLKAYLRMCEKIYNEE